MERHSLSIVVPCFNEEPIIEAFLTELREVLDQVPDVDATIVVVDDGSTDASLARLNAIAERDHRLLVYSLSRNFGHQNALSAGLDVCDADAVIMMDADLQHPPALVGDLLDRWKAGYDVVSAVRRSTRDAGPFKRASANVFYLIINLISETPIIAGAADFCLLSRRAHQALLAMPERHRFLRGMVSWIGFSRTTVAFDAPSRAAGRSKYTFVKMVSLAFDALFAFSAAPMRVASRIGIMLAGLGLVYLAYIVTRYFVFGDLVRGWGSLASVMLILGGMQLAFIGLIGEYLARVFEQVKGRPLYIFKQRPDAVTRQ
jgi:glycosyltransferase involved in cell wall biosynthesis